MSIVAKTRSLLGPRVSATSIGPIGVDFGLEALHLVQLAVAEGRPYKVHARASIPLGCRREEVLASQHIFRSLVKRGMNSGPFSGRKVVMAMPAGMFRTISVNYPLSGGKDREAAAVLNVMKDRLDKDLSNYVLDYLPVRTRAKKDEGLALVAVSEREPVINLLELARKARLDVQALEIGPVAISRLVGALSLATDSANVLVVNTGRRASYLTVISGNELLFDQEVAFGEESLIEQAAEALDMPESMTRDLIIRSGLGHQGSSLESASVINAAAIESTLSQILKPRFLKLVDEIKRVCLYAASETRGGAIDHVYLLGGVARWPGSDQLLSSLAGIEVSKVPDVLTMFAHPDERVSSSPESGPEYVVATGAALRGMTSNG